LDIIWLARLGWPSFYSLQCGVPQVSPATPRKVPFSMSAASFFDAPPIERQAIIVDANRHRLQHAANIHIRLQLELTNRQIEKDVLGAVYLEGSETGI
jgi:hypothetical protein